ncbi:MAG: FAD-dependent oxidoreductase, partial [Planctomycetes bacterium]|nr:FAD-dependent oxidoreductase [Planctomycetota bacterium]
MSSAPPSADEGACSLAFDVAVIGGGPAGAAAALGAARAGHSVALFEPQEEPDKPCGEGILPAGVAVLVELGLADLLAHGRALERIRYVLDSEREFEVPLPTPGLALERPVLAAALAQALASEARISRFTRRVSSTPEERGFRLQSGTEIWRAHTLIAADGLQGRSAAW